MDYYILWTAVGAISTGIACIIALFTPYIQYKIEHNKKLKIKVFSTNKFNLNDKNDKVSTICVQILNKGNVKLSIKNIIIVVNKKPYSIIQFPQNYRSLFESQIYKTTFPIELDVEEFDEYNIPIDLLKEKLNNDNSLNKKIEIIILDSLNNRYKYRTKKSIIDFQNAIK